MLTEIVDGHPIGADPADVSEEALNAAGHFPLTMRKVIRAKCLDCCGGQQAEVRKCPAIKCPLWPYRMASKPKVWRKEAPANLVAL